MRCQTRIGPNFASEVTLESFLPSVSTLIKWELSCPLAQTLEPSPGVSYGDNHHIINIKTGAVFGVEGGPS